MAHCSTRTANDSLFPQWVELYEHHDKYKLVGRLRPDIPEASDATAVGEEDDEMTAEEL